MRHLGLLVLALTGLAGCARFESRSLLPARTLAEFEQRKLTDAGLKTYLEKNLHRDSTVWPVPSWDFTNLVLAAFYFHPDLDVARARWALAQAGRKTAAERPNPSINVLPSYDTTTLVPSPWLVTPILDIPIETAGKRGYRMAQAAELSEAARLNVASTAWQVRSRLRRALIDFYFSGQMMDLLMEQQALHSENVRLLEGQFAAGAISAFELTQARLASDSARLAFHDAQRQRAEARVQLAEAIGIPVSALDQVQLSFAGLDQLPPEIDPAVARRQALLERPDVLGALVEYAASQSALQLEIAKQYPDVHLNPGYEFDQGDNKWSLGFTINLPVLNQNKGPIAEAEAKRKEAAANFTALQGRVMAEIDRALAAFRVAVQKQAAANALLTNVQGQERSAQAMLQAGEISRSELAGIRLQLSASALARLDALAKSQQALGQLEDALQSPSGFPSSLWQTTPREFLP